MFIASNTIITTENGNVLASSNYDKTFTINGFISPEKELTSKGATVYLTRETDKDLSLTKNNRKRSGSSSRENN